LSSGDTLPAVPRAAESAFTHSNVRPQGKKGIPKSTICRTTHTNPTELAHAPWGGVPYRDTPTCKLAAARGTCTDSRAPTQAQVPTFLGSGTQNLISRTPPGRWKNARLAQSRVKETLSLCRATCCPTRGVCTGSSFTTRGTRITTYLALNVQI
jgi:hypothetical protein